VVPFLQIFLPKIGEHSLSLPRLLCATTVSIGFCQPHTSWGHKTSHKHSQSRPNWEEATYKPITWVPPCCPPGHFYSASWTWWPQGPGRCWLYQVQESQVVNSQVEHFLTSSFSRWTQSPCRARGAIMVIGMIRGLCVRVCVCVYACLEYHPHSSIASPELNLFDVRYKNSVADWKAKSLFNF
jgi:hypothetical protein